ncbi:MAG: F0F1 ATP synthase subunit epsilon [Acidimicrobiia bacterium]
MANTMRVELVSPERILFSGEATMVVTRVVGGGDIAFQPNHAPYLAALTESHTRIYLANGTVQSVAVHGGFVQVANNTVSILSDIAELAQDIDQSRAQRSLQQAEEAQAKEQTAEGEAAIRRAHARLNAVGGLGTNAAAVRGGH